MNDVKKLEHSYIVTVNLIAVIFFIKSTIKLWNIFTVKDLNLMQNRYCITWYLRDYHAKNHQLVCKLKMLNDEINSGNLVAPRHF